MTAKQVSVGLTYNVKFGDEVQPVTLTRTCDWGGWYGRNEADGTTVRIATAGRLQEQVNGTAAREARIADNTPIHIMENDIMPTSTPEARATRSRRRNATPVATAEPVPSATEIVKIASKSPAKSTRKPAANTTPKESTVSNTTANKPAATRNSRSTKPAAKRKPAAKAKPAARRSGTVKLSGAVATEAKQATLLTQEQANEMVAAAVAAAMAEFTAGVAPTASRKIAAKPKGTAPVKPVVITLEPRDPKVNSYSFKYVGKDENPLVSAVYLTIPLLEQFAENGDAVEIDFAPYTPHGKQKPMPKSKIRYSGTEDSIRDLYVDRAGITALGYSETNCPTVTVAVIKGNRITLTFEAANKG